MRVRLSVVSLIAICACGAPAGQTEIQFEFGRLNARLNNSEFSGLFGRDSIIAIWDSSSGHLQIEGHKRVRGRFPDIVRVTMRCGARPKPGNYAIRNPFTPVSAYAYIASTGWQRIWPLRGQRNRPFLSDSMPLGSLILERVDSVVKGRFEVSLRSFNRAPAETLNVRGTFFGRLLVNNSPRSPVRWAPGYQTDCERIRNAVSM